MVNPKTNVVLVIKELQANEIHHNHCGFGLCPKQFKYLGNPQLLEKIFSIQNTHVSTNQKPRKANEWMKAINCQGCGKQCLLRVDDPICINCREIY